MIKPINELIIYIMENIMFNSNLSMLDAVIYVLIIILLFASLINIVTTAITCIFTNVINAIMNNHSRNKPSNNNLKEDNDLCQM